jgi:hypothetical protein
MGKPLLACLLLVMTYISRVCKLPAFVLGTHTHLLCPACLFFLISAGDTEPV